MTSRISKVIQVLYRNDAPSASHCLTFSEDKYSDKEDFYTCRSVLSTIGMISRCGYDFDKKEYFIDLHESVDALFTKLLFLNGDNVYTS